jgi:acyl-CoA thioester hydrolase
MEQAEHALFREIGSSIMPADFHRSGESEPACTWPRVRCECEFLAPARFEDVIEIRLAVERLGTKSVSYLHEMRIDDRLIARGRIVAVCSIHAQGKLKGFPIPPAIHQALSAYLLTQPDPSA